MASVTLRHGTGKAMVRRIGTRLLHDAPLADLLGRDHGQDWVVPKDAVRFLVVQEASGGGVLTAYDPDGRIVDEHWAPAYDAAAALLVLCAERGVAETPREIPDGVASALSWLDRDDGPPPPSW